MMFTARWALYRLLEKAAGGTRPHAAPPAHTGAPALCVFASTLGELNAIAPFLKAVRIAQPATPLYLLSDHAHYRDSFLRAHEDAIFFAIDHRSETARDFFSRVNTGVFLLAEIPLLPSDAPARLPFAWLRYARKHGAAVVLINGWLYLEQPACRMDRIERWLFAKDSLRHFDLITVQDADTRNRLLRLGARADAVHVAGNLKFDQVPALTARLPLFANRQVIVVGSVNNAPEVDLVLDAFASLARDKPEGALVIAPRHPENPRRTDDLCARLAQRRLHHALHSQHRAPGSDIDCLVLDTMGELASAYAHGQCAHVGINHNVLEPLRFGKVVTVSPGWERRYPSYPVLETMRQAGLVREAANSRELARLWRDALESASDQPARERDIKNRLATFSGATARTLSLWRQAGWL